MLNGKVNYFAPKKMISQFCGLLSNNIQVHMHEIYRKCNFPLTSYVRLLVGRLVGLSQTT